jgi:hypothetical protein
MSTTTETVLLACDMPPTWVAACLAYRAVRQTGAEDQPAWEAARTTVLREFPTMSVRAAGEQASDAIGYASVHYRTWFWHQTAMSTAQRRPDSQLPSNGGDAPARFGSILNIGNQN